MGLKDLANSLNEKQIVGSTTGSEINFLIRAPTGDQVYIFGRRRANCGRQKFPLPFFQIKV